MKSSGSGHPDPKFFVPRLREDRLTRLQYARQIVGDGDRNVFCATALNGVKIEQDDYQNLITRIGFRTGFDFPNEAGTIYAHASYSYDFLGEADGTASQNGLRASLDEDLGGGRVTYGIGGQFRLGQSTFAYGELERSTGGDVDNPWAFNVGLRHLF